MPKYKLTDPDEVERICQKYLADCKKSRDDNIVTLKNNSRMTYGKWPSTEGLALALDISYGHLMRLISKAPDNGGEGDYRGCGGVPSSNDLAIDGDTAQDTVSTDRSSSSNADNAKSSDRVSDGYQEAQRAISECLARVRLQIIDEITEGADTGMIDSRIAQLRLSRLGIAAKVEQDNTRKVEIVGYTPDEIGDLFK